jgi:transposase
VGIINLHGLCVPDITFTCEHEMNLYKGPQLQKRIRELEFSNRGLHRIVRKSKREKVELTRSLRQQEFGIQQSIHIIGPRLHSLLIENRELRIKERQILVFMLRIALGCVTLEQLKQHLQNKIPIEDLATLHAYLIGRSHCKRSRALILIFHLYGIPRDSIAIGLGTHDRTIKKYVRLFERSGVDAVFPPSKVAVKYEDPKYKDALFRILHSPPRNHGFNRTTWRQKDLACAMARNGLPIGEDRIGAIIRNAGYRFMKARKVLTSNDPHYREKVDHIHQILSTLKRQERFFSIDEFGPLAVKQQGGRRLVGPGEYPTIPQFQISKGRLIGKRPNLAILTKRGS